MAGKTVGGALRGWRQELNKNQEEFAAYLTELRGSKVSQEQVSRWENDGPMSALTRAGLVAISGGRIQKATSAKRARRSERRTV